MKKAMIGLAALAVSGCAGTFNESIKRTNPPNERLIEESVKLCNDMMFKKDEIYIIVLGDREYLTFPQIKSVDKVLQEKTDCHLSVYYDWLEEKLEYTVEKGNQYIIRAVFFPESRHVKLYPYDCKEE